MDFNIKFTAGRRKILRAVTELEINYEIVKGQDIKFGRRVHGLLLEDEQCEIPIQLESDVVRVVCSQYCSRC